MLRGALAAALTPLRAGGALDEDAFAPYAAFLAAGGLDGMLALGTTGEGMLFGVPERKRVAELYIEARGTLQVAVNCGAQTTVDTVALAEHAAATGADAVAVIAPPYFPLDDMSVLVHLHAAAHACAPTPFYVYEFARASGYAVSHLVLERLREQAPNLAGMKVSDSPWEAFEPYLHEGLDVFVGPEALIGRGMHAGAVGAVSALGSAFPEHVARAVRERSDDLAALRDAVERFPRHAALKLIAARRGVPMQPFVRAPLRRLSGNEERELFGALAPWLDGE
jgi:dihydrodipicolinate synthase/N-acetylneuraminate lyase